MREHRRIGGSREHAFVAERRRRILDQRHMIAKLHTEAAGGLDATVGNEAD